MARRAQQGGGGAPPPAAAVLQCQVCQEQPSKYKCPGCALRYCSVACCKAHKAAPCPGSTGTGTGAGASTAPPQSVAGRKRGREEHTRGPRRGDEEEEDDDQDLPILTPEMQRALQESKWLQAALGDSTLRRLLADIDGSSSTAEDAAPSSALTARDRAARLKEALERYPDLQAFVDRMLMEVGALKYEDGRLVFT